MGETATSPATHWLTAETSLNEGQRSFPALSGTRFRLDKILRIIGPFDFQSSPAKGQVGRYNIAVSREDLYFHEPSCAFRRQAILNHRTHGVARENVIRSSPLSERIALRNIRAEIDARKRHANPQRNLAAQHR